MSFSKNSKFGRYKLESSLVRETFRKLFKSITANGGTEFIDFDGIEKSSDGTKRTELYFAHSYCASERGTNENHNRCSAAFTRKIHISLNLIQSYFVKFKHG